MAISNNPALKNNVPTGAPAPAPAPTPKPTAGGASNKTNPAVEAFRAAGKELRTSMSDDEKAAEGSKAHTLAFVASLGDPKNKQDRVENGNSIPSNLVVGFRFKAIEPLTYTKMPLKENAKDIIDVDFSSNEQVSVGAGQEFDVNLMEMARLLSDPLYAGSAAGSDKSVYLTYKSSRTRKEMLPVLACTGKGSVKEGMILIGQQNAEGNWEAKPEFAEKFSVLYTKKARVSKGSAATKDADQTRKEVAAAFRSFFIKKGQEPAQA